MRQWGSALDRESVEGLGEPKANGSMGSGGDVGVSPVWEHDVLTARTRESDDVTEGTQPGGDAEPPRAVADAAVPTRVRVAMGHAALAFLADVCGADVLHIKGVAVHHSFRRTSGGTDADVIVRPSHVERYFRILRQEGWRQLTSFETDSDFGSAATFRHDLWGFADVHRFFPGVTIPIEDAFDRMWRDRVVQDIAGYPCAVPDVVAQSVVLVLNAARSGRPGGSPDVEAAWLEASPERRQAMVELVADLGAQVGFAAGTGELERFRGSRQYRLWKIESAGGAGRATKWLARIWAAPSLRGALRLALRAPLVNTDHLAIRLGRRPTRVEVVREFFARLAGAAAQGLRAVALGFGRRRRP